MIQRVRLPPADTSPARARAAVAELLVAAGLAELRAEALLLTSELVTNGVMHAGTDLEVEFAVDAEGLRVSVTDFAVPDPAAVVADVTATIRPAVTRVRAHRPRR